MRYAQGGGLTAVGRARREAVRLQAAESFGADTEPPEIARRMRVTPQSVYSWRRQWQADGVEALVSKGPLGRRCKLSPRCQIKLAAMPDESPAAHGWVEDQVWTGARVATLIGRKFHVSYSVPAATRLMRRLGFTPQMPGRRAAQRDEAVIAEWRESTWPATKSLRAAVNGWVCFEDEAGQQQRRPPKGRTWGRRGITPIVKVDGRSSGKVSVAGLIAWRPGERTRFCYRIRIHRASRRKERKSLSERDCIGLLDAVHQQLGAPIVLVWDRLNTHVAAEMKELIAVRERSPGPTGWPRCCGPASPLLVPDSSPQRRRDTHPLLRKYDLYSGDCGR